MNDLHTRPDADHEWQETCSRVRAYLQAMGIARREEQERILTIVLERIASRGALNGEPALPELAMQEIRGLSKAWFEKVLAPRERADVAGLVSWEALDAREKWPAAFLAEEIPGDVQQALRGCAVQAAPDPRVSRMVPQPFANPLHQASRLTAPLGELPKVMAPWIAKGGALALWALSLWPGGRGRL
jgi:hypothetical protein